MKPFVHLAIAAFLFSVATLPSSAAPEGQPHMKAALELLQAAKKSDNPMPMLLAAKKQFHEAKKNKGGALAQAAQSLDDAIAEARVGDKKKLEEKINAAIANVQNGIGNAK